MPVYAIPFDELGLDDIATVGGKSAYLGELIRGGLPVPRGFAVPVAAFQEVLRAWGSTERIDGLQRAVDWGDPVSISAAEHAIRREIEALSPPAAVTVEVAASYERLSAAAGRPDVPVAIRSSASAEDGPAAGFAGMHDTHLWVRGPAEVMNAIRRCWGSHFSAKALSYRHEHGLDGRAGMGIAVQQMVDSRVAGALFPLNPISGDRSTIIIESAWGLGVALMGGEVSPDFFLYDKVTRHPRQTRVVVKNVECVPGSRGVVSQPVPRERRTRPSLGPGEIERLLELAREVEHHFGDDQQLEWALDRNGSLPGNAYLLQSRPITATARRSPRTRAGVGRDPTDHVVAYLTRARNQR